MPVSRDDLYLKIRAAGGRQARRELDSTASGVRRVGREAKAADKNALRASSSFRLFSKGMGRMRFYASSLALTLGVAGVAGGIEELVHEGTNLQTQLTRTRNLFGANARAVEEWGKTGARAFGMSQAEALAAADTFGAMLKPLGIGSKDAAGMSESLVHLAGDLASLRHTDPASVIKAFQSGLAGMPRAMKRLGVNLDSTRLKQEALNLGLYSGKGTLTAQAKAIAAYALTLRDTKRQQGAFAKNSGNLDNAEKALHASVNNLQEDLGLKLLPVLTDGTNELQKFVDGMESGNGAGGEFASIISRIWKFVKKFWPELAILTAAWITYHTAVWSATKAMLVFKAVNELLFFLSLAKDVRTLAEAWYVLDAAMSANVFGLIVVAIAALVVGLIVAYHKVKWFHDAVDATWDAIQTGFNWIKDHWKLLTPILLAPFAPLILALTHIGSLIRLMKKAWNEFANLANGLSGPARGLLGKIGIHIPKIPTFDLSEHKRTPRGGADTSRSGKAVKTTTTLLSPALPGGGSQGSTFLTPFSINLDGKTIAKGVHRQGVKDKARR